MIVSTRNIYQVFLQIKIVLLFLFANWSVSSIKGVFLLKIDFDELTVVPTRLNLLKVWDFLNQEESIVKSITRNRLVRTTVFTGDSRTKHKRFQTQHRSEHIHNLSETTKALCHLLLATTTMSCGYCCFIKQNNVKICEV